MIKKIVLTFSLLFFIGMAAFSQQAAAKDSELILKVAVMGAGDEVYFWFGHIGLIIENSATGQSRFYDWGLFSFDNENFYLNFAMGRLLYSCGVSQTESNLNVYRKNKRSIFIYTLDVPQETILKVKEFADFNVLPKNRDYYYHHFRDNCSTRIRDIIDIAANGQFSAQFKNEKSRFTLRDHVRRHTWFSPAIDWFLNFLMGQVIDVPITVWDDMFLPAEVGKRIEDFYYTDINGVRRKLVSSVETAAVFDHPAVLDTPGKQWPYQLIFSIFLSLVFCFFFFLQSKKILAGKILAGFSISVCGLVFGLSGLILYFLSLFTNHDYTFQNANMIFCTPLLLVTLPLGIGCIVTKNHFKYLKYNLLIRIIWLLCVLGIFLSMLIKLLPGFYQDNLTDQLLMLPIAITFAFQPAGLNEIIDKFFPQLKQNAQLKQCAAKRNKRTRQ